MKKLITLLALIVMTTINAQAPQGFNYQATVRNSAGALIVNQSVYFKFNLMLNSQTSVPVFTETHYVPTDDLGQVNLVIGQGTPTTGTFSTINWGTGNYYLGIELNTGSGYVPMGTTQLLSVPYALYANSSGNATTATPNLASVLAVNNSANNSKITNLANPINAQDAVTKQYVDSKIPNGTNVGDNLTWNGTNWGVSSANTVVPVAPSNLTGVVGSSTQINLSWTDNSTNETVFKIERKTGSGTYTIVGTTATDITTFSDAGLTTNTNYTYRVYSNNAGGNSLTYSNEVTLAATVNVVPVPITIGTQIWQNANLDVTTYRDGTPIPEVTDQTQWNNLTTGAWCHYNNTTPNGTTYGKLYNWYALAGIDDNDPNTPNKILAPSGWHIPSVWEWYTLSTFLGGESVAGGKMKATGTSLWQSPNTGATNSSGFTGLPGGNRGFNNMDFLALGTYTSWWSSSPYQQNLQLIYTCVLGYSDGNVIYQPIGKYYGAYVRCLRD